jgi:paraquat-inducible protein B
MSGEDRGRQTATGIFVLGGSALAIAAVVLFGNFNIFGKTLRAVVVFQDSISGLTVGAPVTFRGVRLGSVQSIAVTFDPAKKSAYIPVILDLEPRRVTLSGSQGGDAIDLPHLIARGLRAELNIQSFVTGQSEIDLEFDPESPSVLHPDIATLVEIPARQSTIQKVQEQLSQLPLRELTDNTNATLQSLRTLTEKLDRGLPPLIDSLRTTSDRSATAIAAVQTRLDATLGDISRLANVSSALLNDRGAELHTVLVSSNQAVVQARDLLKDLKSFTSERGADRANIDSALRDLAAAAAALRGLSGDLEHNPQLLLTGRHP